MAKFRLFGVVYHNGREATKGHYVADVYHTGRHINHNKPFFHDKKLSCG